MERTIFELYKMIVREGKRLLVYKLDSVALLILDPNDATPLQIVILTLNNIYDTMVNLVV